MSEPVHPARPEWSDYPNLVNHFNLHGRKFGYTTVVEYEASSKATVARGRRFTYRDHSSRQQRVGYFDATAGHLTVLANDDLAIINHFPARESYVRNLPESDY